MGPMLRHIGPHHYWLNRSVKNKQFFGFDGVHGIFLVLAACNFECGIIFQKLKAIQERFPHITIMGIKLTNSSDRENIIQLLMTENITFPILSTQWTFPQAFEAVLFTDDGEENNDIDTVRV
ncbi:60S ribosomal protein L15 [Trifolium repens]|nr:60S ribosomal protein L15 [Trifolium repens]